MRILNHRIISQSNPQEKSSVELSVVHGNRDRSRARLNPKSARWLISIKPNYYLRLGSVWHVIRKQLFFILSLSLVFFHPPVCFSTAVATAALVRLGRVYQIELSNVVRNTNQGKSNGKHTHKIVLRHQSGCCWARTEYNIL